MLLLAVCILRPFHQLGEKCLEPFVIAGRGMQQFNHFLHNKGGAVHRQLVVQSLRLFRSGAVKAHMKLADLLKLGFPNVLDSVMLISLAPLSV